jgi:hypothetical protein
MTKWRPPLTAEDDWNALQALKAWFAEHPESTDPAEGVAALGLPDMTGIPSLPAARTSIQKRMAREADDMFHHAQTAITQRDHPLKSRRTA